jgi:hypothetical protein
LTVLPTALATPTNAQVKQLDAALTALGRRRRIRVVNLYPVFIQRLNLFVDGVHPDDRGYAMISRALAARANPGTK